MANDPFGTAGDHLLATTAGRGHDAVAVLSEKQSFPITSAACGDEPPERAQAIKKSGEILLNWHLAFPHECSPSAYLGSADRRPGFRTGAQSIAQWRMDDA
jgi:hypothetical protein